LIGLPEVPGGDMFKPAPAQLGAGQPQIIDVTPAKARALLEAKASPAQSIERRIEKMVTKYLANEYEKAAAALG
jgi:hypothetical protein